MSDSRFKFRAWNGRAMEYGGFGSVAILLEDVFSSSPIMQWTGLADRNGADIYEGDIIRFISYFDEPDESQVYKIIFGHSEFWKGMMGFHAVGKDDEYWDYYGGLPDLDETVVIGNIYKNPHLMEKSK